MKRYLTAVLLVLVSIGTSAAAQARIAVTADVPFAFFVGSKSFPAGMYEFTVSDNLTEITLRNLKGKDSGVAGIITQLSPKPGNEASIVFDVTGADHYLSEIFPPGVEGFLVKGAPGKHTHVSVKAKK